MDFTPILKEFGLTGLFSIAVVSLLFFIVKWTLAFVRDLIKQYNADRESWLKQAALEREAWMRTADKQAEAWNEHTVQAKIFHDSVNEAHRYQREEHQKLLVQADVICKCLQEVEQGLGRINGYTDKH